MNKENRYRVEVTIPVWVYMEPEYMEALDTATQEDIVNKLVDDLEVGVLSFMDVKHWNISVDNPTVSWNRPDDDFRVVVMHDVDDAGEFGKKWHSIDDEPIGYSPVGE